MPVLTEKLLRRKAEHNDGLLSDMEEVSLHQCELESVQGLSTWCPKLQILYLQNNVLPSIHGMHKLRDLRYLNMTLNNVTVIKAPDLRACEFLNKLDLTCNFIDVDGLEETLDSLRQAMHLRELFLMGNPLQDWEQHRRFVIASLPQLQSYDGKEVTRSERILAAQDYATDLQDLRTRANAKLEEKGLPTVDYSKKDAEGDGDEDDVSPWTPEERLKMYREMAEQKAEQEKSKSHLDPVKRDYEKEQAEAIERAREREARGEIRQCNQGRWPFKMVDDDGEGNVQLRVPLPRFLDTSLVDVDVHPTYVTIVIKGKILRLRFPEEVNPDSGTAQRSATTGELVLTLPITDQRAVRHRGAPGEPEGTVDATTAGRKKGGSSAMSSTRVKRFQAPEKLGDALLEEASKAVSIKGIVQRSGEDTEASKGQLLMTSVKETRTGAGAGAGAGEDFTLLNEESNKGQEIKGEQQEAK